MCVTLCSHVQADEKVCLNLLSIPEHATLLQSLSHTVPRQPADKGPVVPPRRAAAAQGGSSCSLVDRPSVPGATWGTCSPEAGSSSSSSSGSAAAGTTCTAKGKPGYAAEQQPAITCTKGAWVSKGGRCGEGAGFGRWWEEATWQGNTPLRGIWFGVGRGF
jgi:hypothetical protein